MNNLADVFLSNSQSISKWAHVTRRFTTMQRNLVLRQGELDDGRTKLRGVITCLNRWFFEESVLDNCLLAGSWRKNTAIRPPTDIDIFFQLPVELFDQFNARIGNKQSQLLQHVREALAITYKQTRIRGDGQVVVVGFNTVNIEVIPAFLTQTGRYLICDTNSGGRWKHVDPGAEFAELDRTDASFNGNVRKLTRILKQWKRHCNVPIKSFHLEQLVRETLAKYEYGGSDEFWFDWLVRDTFAHMIERAGEGFFMPGTTVEWIEMGDGWQSKAWTAYHCALRACDYERQNMDISAGMEWHKIFGAAIPVVVT